MPEYNKVFNANVYLADKSLVGRAQEVGLPDLEFSQHEHTGLGMFGSIEMPQGLNALTASIKWNGFYADHLKHGSNPFKRHSFQIRGSVDVNAPGGRVEELPVVWHLNAGWKKQGLGSPKPKEAMEFEDELAVTYVKVTHGGTDVMEIDVFENIWIVDGEDVMATWRENLGI